MNKNNYSMVIILTVFPLMAIIANLWATNFNIGVSPDSIIYVESARNFAVGEGLQFYGETLVHLPPLYPLIISISGFFGIDPFISARWLNSIFYAITILSVGLITMIATNKSKTAVFFSMLAILSSFEILHIQSMAWSEPLFFFLFLVSVLNLCLYFLHRKFKYLIGASVFMGFSMITRYVGVVLVLPMIVMIFLFDKSNMKMKIKNALIFVIVGILPLLIVLSINKIFSNSMVERTITFHPIPLSAFRKLIQTTFGFWLPFNLPTLAELLIILIIPSVILGATWSLIKRKKIKLNKDDLNFIVIAFSFIFILSYISFLFFSISFIDAATPFSSRILSPLYFMMVIFLISFFWKIAKLLEKKIYWESFLFLLASLIVINISGRLKDAIDINQRGTNFTGRVWVNSESVGYVKSLPKNIKIYSNGADVLRFLTDKNVLFVPQKYSPTSLVNNNKYHREFEEMRDAVLHYNAQIIYLNRIAWRDYLISSEEISKIIPIKVITKLHDGIVYAGLER